jgi:transposase
VFGFGPATRIYLAVGSTDMRKGFEGLYGLVRDRLQCEPLSGHVFLFCNQQRNRLKLRSYASPQPVLTVTHTAFVPRVHAGNREE